MNSNSPTLRIDCRSGSVEMQLATGERLEGEMPQGWDRTALAASSLLLILRPAAPPSAPAPPNSTSSAKGDA